MSGTKSPPAQSQETTRVPQAIEEPSPETEQISSEIAAASAPPRRIRTVIHEAVRQELRIFRGPLPPPDVLADYNKVYPGCGKEVVQMARDEQRHRHQIEDRQTDGDLTLAKRGQLIGGFLALALVIGAIYLVSHDKPVSGLSVLGGVVVAFGGAFIYDRYQRARDAKQQKGRETQEIDKPYQSSPETSESDSATRD